MKSKMTSTRKTNNISEYFNKIQIILYNKHSNNMRMKSRLNLEINKTNKYGIKSNKILIKYQINIKTISVYKKSYINYILLLQNQTTILKQNLQNN